MTFTPERAAIRFGCGLSPRQAAPTSAGDMLAQLAGPDHAAIEFPIPGMDVIYGFAIAERDARRAVRAAETQAEQDAANDASRKARRTARNASAEWLGQTLMRRAQTPDGFRERLTAFWADHFTAVGRGRGLRFAQVNYIEEAIRPHVTGRFSDLLRAAVTNPVMLQYLDQVSSVGPNSRFGKRRPDRGLNENLAREVMELHTLGVGGPYSQADVRQFAELLTGMGLNFEKGFVFRSRRAEPGPQTIMGRAYDGKDRLASIFAALDDLAAHPATARHIARKLAVHFVGDAPDPTLADALETRFAETGGDLMAVYEALLAHPVAWSHAPGNVKQPLDYVGSCLRALDLNPRQMPGKNLRQMRRIFFNPLILMGQTWTQADGPDGWPEADDDWITPQRFAARLQWAMFAPLRLRRILPDPRDFVDIALGSTAPEEVRFAATAAETRPEGIGVVLASAAFQRM